VADPTTLFKQSSVQEIEGIKKPQ